MANKFNHGDVVVIKSGGPPMTVDRVPGEKAVDYPYEDKDEYHCEWFKGASAQRGYFAEHLLETYTPPAKK
ncbi:DUF2158 domain-containing protein [Novosphingobium sp. ZN18A2]|uniref:YodC family protein n=1 Tax=Novosphingobium sp. ZN18A2 TaxID=3079861 RepID=UPI0030D14CDB